MRFAVLGPVRAWRGEEPMNLGSPQQRAVLAALLLRGGRHITVEELVDAVWGEDPPRDAVGTIRTYASRLRKALGADEDLLRGEAGGYAIRLHARAELDVEVATRLAEQADAALSEGRPERARLLLNRALDRWDGEPLAGLPGPRAEGQRTRLAEWRLALLEQRLELDIQAGSHADAVSELTTLASAHPLRERFRELLMLALYRGGRQAEALAVYTDTRRLLADELGLEPGSELASLQQEILQAGAQPRHPSPTSALAPPAQLPATVADFTGRAGFVEELGKQMAQARGMVMAVSSVSGIGGVGKTTLAVHIAHAARESFPDGQLYVDLQGAGPSPAEPATVLGAFLRALGVPGGSIPGSAEERAALYRSTLAGRRVLALLDNARDSAQVRPLLPGTEGCAALITSRARMTDLAGTHHVGLDVMSPDEALLLFTRIVGPERVEPERDAAMDVVTACGFLPLAIRIAASRLAARRTWTVSMLARKLSDEHRRLDVLQVGDLAVTATFELGYGQLKPEQARAFRLLALADGPDISLSAAAALLDRDIEDAEELLEALVDASLLESAAPGRYRYHDLVRLFARACAERDEQPQAQRDAALSRLLDFYLATAATAYGLGRPGDRLPAHVAPLEGDGLSFEDRAKALDWLFTEADCLLAAARQLATGGTLRRAADLLLAAKDLAESGIYSLQLVRVAAAVLEAAHEADDVRSQGRAQLVLSSSHIFSGRFDQADVHATRAMLFANACDDVWVCAEAANDRGLLASFLGRSEETEGYLEQARAAYRADGHLDGEATVLINLSRMYTDLDRTDTAVELAEQAMAIYRKLNAPLGLACSRYALGIALNAAGRHQDALDQFTQALALFRAHRTQLWDALTHFRMAEVHLSAQRPAQAAALAEQALTQLQGMGGDWHRANILTVLGRALHRIGQPGRARACWDEALALHERSGSPQADEVRALLSKARAPFG